MPSIRVSSVRQLFNDGNHNAFTDLCRFRDRLYLTFRSCPDGHMLFTSSRIVVLSSVDGSDWQPVHTFSVANRDVRDPHLLVFNDKLFVYTGAWWVNPDNADDRDVNDHLGFCAWSEDGANWHGPRMLDGTHGHYIWRAAAHGATAYLIGRRIRNFDVLARRDEPPEDVKMLRVLRDQILGEPDEDTRDAMMREVFEIHMDNIWSIGLVVDDPKFGQLTNVHNRLRNVVTWSISGEWTPTIPAQWFINE